MNEGTFTQQTHSIGNYIAGNPSFQVRFGIGTTDGSVTYTGWNIDDVVVEPAGGLAGNWRRKLDKPTIWSWRWR